MRDYPHYSNYNSLRDAIIGFVQLARTNNLNCGVRETMDALQIGSTDLIHEREDLNYSLKALLCSSLEEVEKFDEFFKMYWRTGGSEVQSTTIRKITTDRPKKTASSIVMLGRGAGKKEGNEARNISGANAEERLRNTDFAKLGEIESDYLNELAMKMWRQMNVRLKRRLKAVARGSRIDLRQTIRQNVKHGGDPIELRMKSKKRRKERLVVLLDVSGSMDKYSLFLLKFVWSLKAHFERIEAFIFSTRIERITDYLHINNIDSTLETLSKKVNNWSSGTRIGSCFNTFNQDYAKRILNGRSTVIILSDGLDTGSPELLNSTLRRMKLQTNRIIWLNPLKGMTGYRPIQQGMSAALSEIDVFKSAHSLNSLLELEELLIQV